MSDKRVSLPAAEQASPPGGGGVGGAGGRKEPRGGKRKHDTEPRHVHVAIGKCSGQRSSRIVSDGRSVVPLSTSVLHCDDTVIVERVCG